MLEEPDEVVCLAGRNRGGSRRHGGKRRFVGDRRRFDTPCDRRAGGYGSQRRNLVARINHPLTMVVLFWIRVAMRCQCCRTRRLRHLVNLKDPCPWTFCKVFPLISPWCWVRHQCRYIRCFASVVVPSSNFKRPRTTRSRF